MSKMNFYFAALSYRHYMAGNDAAVADLEEEMFANFGTTQYELIDCTARGGVCHPVACVVVRRR